MKIVSERGKVAAAWRKNAVKPGKVATKLVNVTAKQKKQPPSQERRQRSVHLG